MSDAAQNDRRRDDRPSIGYDHLTLVPDGGESDEIGIDTPDGWEHESGYHLNADGKRIEYAGGEFRVTIEATVDGVLDTMVYVVGAWEQLPDGDEEPVMGWYPFSFESKDDALDAAENAMEDLEVEG